MVNGFPIAGAIPSGGCGIEIHGGQRVHGKPGLGGPDPITELRQMCRARNVATIKAAKARTPTTPDDLRLAEETWSKLKQDIARGFMGEPMELNEIDMDKVLLVDCFGVWERHDGMDWKVRVISNF